MNTATRRSLRWAAARTIFWSRNRHRGTKTNWEKASVTTISRARSIHLVRTAIKLAGEHGLAAARFLRQHRCRRFANVTCLHLNSALIDEPSREFVDVALMMVLDRLELVHDGLAPAPPTACPFTAKWLHQVTNGPRNVFRAFKHSRRRPD